MISDDKDESALSINYKASKLKINDFNVLAASLKINENPLHSIYSRFDKVLPVWTAFIQQSFLSKKMQKAYIALIKEKYTRYLHNINKYHLTQFHNHE